MLNMGRCGNVFYTYFTSRWNEQVYKVEVEVTPEDTALTVAKKLSEKADQKDLQILEQSYTSMCSSIHKR